MDRRVSYKLVAWSVFLVTTAVFVYDRFVTNAWPRQSFSTQVIPRPGGDSFYIKPGPASYKAYQILARFSGRYSMACFNMLLFTMMHSFHDWLASSWVGRYVVNMEDSKAARLQMHRWLGISLCVFTLVHIWSIFAPVLVDGYTVQVNPGSVGLPLSEYTPAGFRDVDVSKEHVMLQIDDVWRLVLMTIILIPLMWYSIKWMASNYRFGVRVHQFIMLMYFIDIVRRHTHPHSWVLNAPVFCLWLLDHLFGLVYHHEMVDMCSIPLGQDYVLLVWKSKFGVRSLAERGSVGEVFRMRFPNSKACYRLERKHPFTSFSPRGAELSMDALFREDSLFKVQDGSLVAMKSDNTSEPKPTPGEGLPMCPTEWNRGALVRTYTARQSHTAKLRASNGGECFSVHAWGPVSENSVGSVLRRPHSRVMLVGGGSGCAYMLDALLMLAAAFREDAMGFVAAEKVLMVLCTRDQQVASFFCNVIDQVFAGNPRLQSIVQVQIAISSVPGCKSSRLPHASSLKLGWSSDSGEDDLELDDVVLGRPVLSEILQRLKNGQQIGKTHVFCQAGQGLQQASRVAARLTGCVYHEGLSFDNPPKANSQKANENEQKRTLSLCCFTSTPSPKPVSDQPEPAQTVGGRGASFSMIS